LAIRAFADPESIHFIIRDDGVGMTAEQLARLREKLSDATEVADMLERPSASRRTAGMGLANVHARLLIHFGTRYRIRIDSDEGSGTEVELILPREPDPEHLLDGHAADGLQGGMA
jgi:two-component system sensor histidine kinase YesM